MKLKSIRLSLFIVMSLLLSVTGVSAKDKDHSTQLVDKAYIWPGDGSNIYNYLWSYWGVV